MQSRRITRIDAFDIRFPTSRSLDGSDAMNKAPDYSAAFAVIHTDADDGLQGFGLTFTLGRGNELCVEAIRSLSSLVVGRSMEEITDDMGSFWRHVAGDSHYRWLGPEKGVIHLATAAIFNGLWDLWAKMEGKPLWRLLSDMTPEKLVSTLDFRHVKDMLTPEQAIARLSAQADGKAARIAELERVGYPAYTTSAGWLGYSEEKMRQLCRDGVAKGWTHFKQKVGGDLSEDMRRARIIREEIGPDRVLMMDANQVWEVDEAIAHMRVLAEFKPLFIEEPLSPDDILGHARVGEALRDLGIGVATGEHCHNRVMFKQFFQARGIDYCQLDAARLGGVNEVVLVVLLADKAGVPVCPHAGGVGLCELVQHISMFDYVAVSGSMEGRFIEYVDHLHEHFKAPVVIEQGRYKAPEAPGYGAEIYPENLRTFSFPDGAAWREG